MCDLIKHDVLLWLVLFQQLWMVHFDPCWLLSDLLPRRSAVVRLSCCYVFWSWASTFLEFLFHYPVDVVRVKSYVNCLLDPARVVISVTVRRAVNGILNRIRNRRNHQSLEKKTSSMQSKKSSSIQSKRRDLYRMWLHRETSHITRLKTCHLSFLYFAFQ